MKLKFLKINNFRNIESCELTPNPKINFFIGLNGQGKTSLLETIGYLSSLRSFKGAKTEDVIRWKEDHANIECELYKEDWSTQFRVFFQNTNGKTSKVAFINQKPYRSSTQFLLQRFGQVEMGYHTISFNPSDHDLIKGDPVLRRNYLDRILSSISKDYLLNLSKYQKLLDQRNALLKNDQFYQMKHLLAGFSEPLAKYSAEITLQRLQWFLENNDRLKNASRQIAQQQAPLSACFYSSFMPEISGFSKSFERYSEVHFTGHNSLPTLDFLMKSYLDFLNKTHDLELRLRSTQIGPHRDDWGFQLDDRDLQSQGSQGEIRTSLLALKLAEIDWFKKQTGLRPVFLLDDFSSELDRTRRELLMQLLIEMDLQVFVTSTEEPTNEMQRLGSHWKVEQGKIYV
jgi:DNA replication and repair protein RecF